MKNSTIIMMTIAVVLAAIILLAINFLPILSIPEKQTYINMNNVRGSAVIYKGKPYTLNFEQQNQLIDILNKAVLVKKSDYPSISKDFDFDKIGIYPFTGSQIEIQPIRYDESNLVFSAPVWNKNYYFMELSAGSLKEIIRSSHD